MSYLIKIKDQSKLLLQGWATQNTETDQTIETLNIFLIKLLECSASEGPICAHTQTNSVQITGITKVSSRGRSGTVWVPFTDINAGSPSTSLTQRDNVLEVTDL